MNRDEKQKEYKARGLELAKGLGLASEKALLRLCADEQQEVSARGVACLALGFLRYKAAVPVLLKLANHRDIALVVNATRSLEMIGSLRAVGPMMSLAQGPTRTEVRNRAIDVLGALRDNRAERLLVAIVNSRAEDQSTRCCAADAIAGLQPHSEAALAGLLGLLKEPSAILRWTALNSLGVMGDRSAIPAIQALLEDKEIVSCLPSPQPSVSDAAEKALKNIKSCAQSLSLPSRGRRIKRDRPRPSK
jgi:HEAT repeat protein